MRSLGQRTRMQQPVRCMWMRGGTSKGGYFLADDLPADPPRAIAFLLARHGLARSAPDRRHGRRRSADQQGRGRARSPTRPGVDVDYLFLPGRSSTRRSSPTRRTAATSSPASARSRSSAGWCAARDDETRVAIFMENTGQVADRHDRRRPGGGVDYDGEARIDGVPGTAAPVPTRFPRHRGLVCGALLPTGNAVDMIDGVDCTLIDNGMPASCSKPRPWARPATRTATTLDSDTRAQGADRGDPPRAGPLMNLGDVARKSVPKMMLVAPPRARRRGPTRSFIPHRAPRHDRRARRGQRGDRLPASGLARRARAPSSRRAAKDAVGRASDRRVHGQDRGRRDAGASRGRARRPPAHRAKAFRRAGLPS